MKLKTKLFASLFVVLMLGMSTSAFADLACALTTTPVPREVLNSHWANVGDLVVTCTGTNATATTEASLTLFYGGFTITNSATVPAAGPGHAIAIINGAPSAAAALDLTRTDSGLGGTGISNSGSLIALNIPAMANPTVTCPTACIFTVTNVLVSASGAATAGGSLNLSANVISLSGNTTLSGAPIILVTAFQPYLSSTTNPPALAAPIVGQPANPAQFQTTGAILPPSALCNTAACQNARASFAVTVSEDHIDSWRTPVQYYNNGLGVTVVATNVLFTFSGMLPGSIISNCVIGNPTQGTGTSTWTLTGNGIAGSGGTTQIVAELTGGATDLTTVETLTLTCGTSTVNPAYLVGSSTGAATVPITVSMSAWPQGSALPGAGGSPSATVTPRFQTGSSVGPVTVITFGGGVTGQTTLLIPFAVASSAAVPPAGTFNTGFSIANTTKDPASFGTDAQGAAVDTAGNVTFVFFPSDGSPSFTVTPTTGFGLVGGVIQPGASFIGNLSQVLQLASPVPPSFSGYVFINANFTHAHGSAFLYGGTATDRLASNQDVLVIGPPSVFSRNLNFGVVPPAEVTTK